MATNARITDIRVALTMPGNRKVKALRRALGSGACWSLVQLWIYCAGNEPDGALLGWTDDDVESAADWDGTRGEFVANTVRIGLLDRIPDGGFQIHDWAENQPWVANAPARSAAAKRAISARWDRRKAETDTARIQGEYGVNTESILPSLPSPSLPSQTISRRTGKPVLDTYSPEFEELWQAFPTYRRKGKGAAWAAYRKRQPSQTLHDRMVESLKAQVSAFAVTGKSWEFFPMATTWINQARWDDESAMPPVTHPQTNQAVITPRPMSGPGSQTIAPLREIPDDEKPTLGLRAVVEQVRNAHGGG